MSDSLHSASPVDRVGGFAGRAPNRQPGGQPGSRKPEGRGPEVAVDAVQLSTLPVRQLLRERVLAATRAALALPASTPSVGPVFAEAVDSEPLTTFVGRLLSAQQQLAGATHQGHRLLLASAFDAGAAEAVELLGEGARAVVNGALAAYAERIGSGS